MRFFAPLQTNFNNCWQQPLPHLNAQLYVRKGTQLEAESTRFLPFQFDRKDEYKVKVLAELQVFNRQDLLVRRVGAALLARSYNSVHISAIVLEAHSGTAARLLRLLLRSDLGVWPRTLPARARDP